MELILTKSLPLLSSLLATENNFIRRKNTMAEWIKSNWAEIVAFFDKLYAILKQILGEEEAAE